MCRYGVFKVRVGSANETVLAGGLSKLSSMQNVEVDIVLGDPVFRTAVTPSTGREPPE
jgi:hypothetical protein